MTPGMWYLVAYFVFGVGLGTAYYLITWEDIGWILLTAMGLATAFVVAYALRRTGRRTGLPEDDPAAELASGAGTEIGSFPTASAWPLFLVLGVVVIGASLVYGLVLLPLGAAVFAWAVYGLMRESRD